MRERLQRIRMFHQAPQSAIEQGQRLQRLAQVMTGGSQEAPLGAVGPIGCFACRNEVLLGSLSIRHVADRSRHQYRALVTDGTQADLHRKLGAILVACEELEARAHGAAPVLRRKLRPMAQVAGAKSLGDQQLDRLPPDLLTVISK